MNIFVLAFLLPCVLGQDATNCPELPVCGANQIDCGHPPMPADAPPPPCPIPPHCIDMLPPPPADLPTDAPAPCAPVCPLWCEANGQVTCPPVGHCGVPSCAVAVGKYIGFKIIPLNFYDSFLYVL